MFNCKYIRLFFERIGSAETLIFIQDAQLVLLHRKIARYIESNLYWIFKTFVNRQG